jgi:hypothetical protein
MPHPVYVIFQTTQHNTHTHALSIIYFLGQMSLWANVFLGKCLSGQTSSGQISFRVNVLLGKRFLKVRFHHHILATNLLTNSPHKQMSDICVLFVSQRCVFLGKCLSGQMSFWANAVPGKYLWANVSWQMMYGQISP